MSLYLHAKVEADDIGGVGVQIRGAANRAAARMVTHLQAGVIAHSGSLGPQIAGSWRARVYENQDGAAAVVSTPFSHVMRAASTAQVIVARDHLYLAIPTENVPRVGRGYATTAQVEAQFGKLIFIASSRPGALLAVVDRGQGSGLPPYVGPDSRRIYPVLMFVLVRQVHLRKRIDIDAVFDAMTGAWSTALDEEVLQLSR